MSAEVQQRLRLERKLRLLESLKKEPAVISTEEATSDSILQFSASGTVFSVKRSSVSKHPFLFNLHTYTAVGGIAHVDADPIIFASVLEYLISQRSSVPFLASLEESRFLVTALDYMCLMPPLRDFPDWPSDFMTCFLISPRPTTWRVETSYMSNLIKPDPEQRKIQLVMRRPDNDIDLIAFDQAVEECAFTSSCPVFKHSQEPREIEEVVYMHAVDFFHEKLAKTRHLGKTLHSLYDAECRNMIALPKSKNSHTVVEYYDYHPGQRLLVRRRRRNLQEAVIVTIPLASVNFRIMGYQPKLTVLPYGYTFSEDRDCLDIPPAIFSIPEDCPSTTPEHLAECTFAKILQTDERIIENVLGIDRCVYREEERFSIRHLTLLDEMKRKKDAGEDWVPDRSLWISNAKSSSADLDRFVLCETPVSF